ncbi:methyltransferase domain-containing protein [Streptomyces sp. SBST2-5]|uniref:Methyltransferase domain-containing protein n=1 Tax=Streptomyces composti TaxID=2720025 RepID=A0ABX1A6Z4_9ACTN|nr:methyltransferase domain-containing protein [Streptomyces composti]NJP49501.1 methyltransferase domain-containing protein [Streptomyces composti]
MMRTDGNVLHHRQAEAAEGHDAFAALYDPTTIRHLEAVGVRPGWRCWGIGSTSLVSWLAKRVGPTGRVLATPVDTTWSAPAARPPVEILNHDIASGEPPAGGFDLVHARLPFVEAADRERAVRAMAAALRPGGHLLIEDTDPELQPLACPDEHGPGERLANRLRRGIHELRTARGQSHAQSHAQGRVLPRLLRQAGLTEVTADAYIPYADPACARLESATVRLLGDRLLVAGLATAGDIEEHLGNLATGELALSAAPLISARGRKSQASKVR